MTAASQTIQDLLDAEVVVDALGFPSNVKALGEAAGDLKRLASLQDGAGIPAAWDRFAAAIGPKPTAALFSSADWPRFCPLRGTLDDYDTADLTQVVWLGDTQKVVATAVMDGDRLVGVRFDCVRREPHRGPRVIEGLGKIANGLFLLAGQLLEEGSYVRGSGLHAGVPHHGCPFLLGLSGVGR
jgi:hypothetical protein